MLEFAAWIKARNATDTDAAADPPVPISPPPARSAPDRPGHGRPRLPRLLPRQRVVHTLPEEQCRCRERGKALVAIGEETSEQLDYKPASLFVVEHVRMKYACTACEGNLVLAEMPAQPIDKGRPGAGLLAQVVTAKYSDHLPLNRQEQIFARHGVDLSRQTLGDWVAAAATLLEPVYRDLTRSVLEGKVVNTDDTAVPVLDRKRPTTRDGYLWVYVGNKAPPDIVYDYTSSRSGQGPMAFLSFAATSRRMPSPATTRCTPPGG